MAPASKSDKKKKEKSFECKNNSGDQRTCCVPEEKVFCTKPEISDPSSVVKVDCSSGKCPKSGLMHAECFEKWEDLIVGFLAKQGRGRTWSDKQRYANVWANKGYDLVFKTCACDCGHGSLRKDLDFVPSKAVDGAAAGAAAQAQPDVQDKKKRKKEKTTLKPKLNFSVLNVSGSYFGSIRQKEDEVENVPTLPYEPLPPRLGQRLSSEKSDSPSPVPIIPGLNPIPVLANINSTLTKFRADPEKFEKASSAPPQNTPEDGWVTVSKPGTNRRNSQQNLKLKGKDPLESFKAQEDNDNANNNLDTQTINKVDSPLPLPVGPPPMLGTPFGGDVHDPELLNKLRKKAQNSFTTGQPVEAVFPSLPMYQPPPSDKAYFESALKYERSELIPSNKNFMNHDLKLSEPPPHLGFPQYFGARPKSSPFSTGKEFNRGLKEINKNTDDIYQSDEDISFEDLDKTIEMLCQASPCLTPKWSASPPKTPTTNQDKEMSMLFEQTKKFEMELNSLKSENNSIPPDTDNNMSCSDGKRDKNGFIHCSSCRTVHTSLIDFTSHCQGIKHRDNAVWAQKLENVNLKADLASGWENFGKVVDNWEERVDAMSESTSTHVSDMNKTESFNKFKTVASLGKNPASAFEEVKRRALSRDVDAKSAINEVKKQVLHKKSKVKSRPNTPELAAELENLRREVLAEKEVKEKYIAEMEGMKKQMSAETEARKKTLEELQILRSSKKNIEKQSVIVENSLKLEESEKLRFEKLLNNSVGLVKDKDEQIKLLKKEKEEGLKKLKDAKQSGENKKNCKQPCDIKFVEIELNETKDLLSQEQQKNEANSKLMKKMKEKSEKSLQREKDSRLLAEKTAELAEKQLVSLEQKNKNLENQLKKTDSKAKDAETKVKEEARKRIVAELDLVEQQKKFNEISDKFVKQAAILNDEKNDLAKAVNGLVKDKEILDEKVNKARAAATERLQDFVNEETSKKILQDSEEIVKQSFMKAIESNEEFDCFDDVKKIFGLVKDVVQSPDNVNKVLLKPPVELDIQEAKTEMKEYMKSHSQVTKQSFKIIFDGLVQEGLSKNDGIVTVESDGEETKVVDNERESIIPLETNIIFKALKEANKKRFFERRRKDAPGRENVVFDLFDEVLEGRSMEEIPEVNKGWEMFEDELVIESSDLNEDLDEDQDENLNEKLIEVRGGVLKMKRDDDLTDDVSKKIQAFFKDDALKNCLTSIFTDAGVPNLGITKDDLERDIKELGIDEKANEDSIILKTDKENIKEDQNKPKPDEEKENELDLNENESNPELDRLPQLGHDEEIDAYLGPDEPGEFDDFEDPPDDDVQNDAKSLNYDEYDIQGCPCKGEHNPNGSCKISPLTPPPEDPLRGPFYHEYFMEQEKNYNGPDTNQMTGEELVAQWDRLMKIDSDPNLRKPKSNLYPLLNRLSTASLPPLPTSSPPTTVQEVAQIRRFSSTNSPDSTSSNTNFSSSTVNSTPPIEATPPISVSPDLIPPSSFQPIHSPDISNPTRLDSLEQSVSVLQSLVTTLGTQVSSLTTQLEDTNFQSGLLSRTVEMMQDRNCQLQRTVDTMEGKEMIMEKKLSNSNKSSGQNMPSMSTNSSEASGMKENLLDLLASCESFQKGFDTMAERQTDLENKLKTVTNNFDRSKSENKELRDQFAKLSDRFSSLNLEYQVDKGQTKAQLDSLGYNVAILTSKIPAESFSSTSGVRSGETSENEEGLEKVEKNDGISPLPPLDTLKDLVSAVVFSREEPGSTEAESSCSSSKATNSLSSNTPTSTTTSSSATKMKKFVYSSSSVNQPFPHPSSAVVGGPVWMSPDGSMVAVPPTPVPPTSTHASLPLPVGAAPRSLYGISPGRGSLSQLGMAQPYVNQQGGMVYPFNYSMQGLNMFYHR